MGRLSKSLLIRRINPLVLPLLLLGGQLSGYAQPSSTVPQGDVTIKTLPPATAAVPSADLPHRDLKAAPAAAPPLKGPADAVNGRGNLESAKSNPYDAPLSPVSGDNRAMGKAMPANSGPDAKSSVMSISPSEKHDLESLSSPRGSRGTLKFTPAGPASGAKSPVMSVSPPAHGETVKPAGPSLASKATPEESLVQPAPPEVTPPAPVAQLGVPQPVAQDAAHNHLPFVQGTVDMRKPFKLSVREELIHNLSFRDAPVRGVLAELARRAGLNIMFDKSVSGNVTGDLRDVTLNEAFDTVLTSAGLRGRQLDNNTVIVGTHSALVNLGLNRTMARAFHLSYSDPWEVAQILHASVFNFGLKSEATVSTETENAPPSLNQQTMQPPNPTLMIPGEQQGTPPGGTNVIPGQPQEPAAAGSTSLSGGGPTQTEKVSLVEDQRPVYSSYRMPYNTMQSGFNDAGKSPEQFKIQGYIEQSKNFPVPQNNGGALVVPDRMNHQVIVVGTPDDIQIADEAIHMLDVRPREVHIQASLIEIRNEALRQLGANLALQGQGLSGTTLGQTTAPLVQYLPGLGSPGPLNTGTNSQFIDNATVTTAQPPPPTVFNRTQSYIFNTTQTPQPQTNVTPTTPASAFTGLLGAVLTQAVPQLGQVVGNPLGASAFNFLTLNKKAGGRANIATMPAGLNLSLNLFLQTQKAKLLANPSVVVQDGTEAFIEIADEIVKKVVPAVTVTTAGAFTVFNPEITKVGVFLDILPRISADGFITMRLRPRLSIPIQTLTFGQGTQSQTTVTLESDKEVITQAVRVKDGQTLVIAGLFSEEELANMGKVPYLSELPIMGALFRNTAKARDRRELMFLLTPKIVEEDPTLSQNPPSPAM